MKERHDVISGGPTAIVPDSVADQQKGPAIPKSRVMTAYRSIKEKASAKTILRGAMIAMAGAFVEQCLQDFITQLAKGHGSWNWNGWGFIQWQWYIAWCAIIFFIATIKNARSIRKDIQRLENSLTDRWRRSYPKILSLLDQAESNLHQLERAHKDCKDSDVEVLTKRIEALDNMLFPYLALSVDHAGDGGILAKYDPDADYINELFHAEKGIYAVSTESVYDWLEPKFFFFLVNNCAANLVMRSSNGKLEASDFDDCVPDMRREYRETLQELAGGSIVRHSAPCFHTIRFFLISRDWVTTNKDLLLILRDLHELFQCCAVFLDKSRVLAHLAGIAEFENLRKELGTNEIIQYQFEKNGFPDFILVERSSEILAFTVRPTGEPCRPMAPYPENLMGLVNLLSQCALKLEFRVSLVEESEVNREHAMIRSV